MGRSSTSAAARAHAARVGDRADARALLVDPHGRDLDDAPAGVAGGCEQVDVEQQVARAEARQHVAHHVPTQDLGPALGVAVRESDQRPHAAREAGAGDLARQRAARRHHRGRMPARGDRAVGVTGGLGQAQQLARRRRAVGVDEPHELGVGAREGLRDHAALPELGVLEGPHALVGTLVGAHDLGRAVRAGVERDEEADARLRAGVTVGTQRAADPFLFVVRWHHDVETHTDLPGLGRSMDGLLSCCGPAHATGRRRRGELRAPCGR